MRATFKNNNVIAQCPSENCAGSITTYENSPNGPSQGYVVQNITHYFNNGYYSRIIWRLLKCASCGSGGLAKIHCLDNEAAGVLESFYPTTLRSEKIPDFVPDDIKKEFREAEKCFSVEAYRGAAALVRSVLEKTLKVNGYNNKDTGLGKKIELAGKEGVINSARSKKAQDKIKVLGDDVLHDEWREVSVEEIEEALHYTQRILEDFYDDRETVVQILTTAKRLGDPVVQETTVTNESSIT